MQHNTIEDHNQNIFDFVVKSFKKTSPTSFKYPQALFLLLHVPK